MNLRAQASQLNPNTVLVIAAAGVGAYLILRDKDLGVEDIPPPLQTQTLPDSTLSAIANRIYAAFWEWGLMSEDEDDMTGAMLECGNDKDVWKVVQFYGVRQGPGIMYPSYDLFQVYAHGLEDEEAAIFNDALAAKGITYWF